MSRYKQPQVSQSLFIGHVLWPLNIFVASSEPALLLGTPELNTALQLENSFPQPASHAAFDAAQDIGSLGCD